MKQRGQRLQRGFSLVELLLVVAIILLLSGMAVPQITKSLKYYRANAAMNQVVGQLRLARGSAIALRRNVQIDFTNPNRIQTHTWTVINENPIPDPPPALLNDGAAAGLNFYVFPGLPDTPMAFGNGSAINLGAAGSVALFTTSGAFVGAVPSPGGLAGVGNSNPVNATIFVGDSMDPVTARAITILGSTGRVRAYTWDGHQWYE